MDKGHKDTLNVILKGIEAAKDALSKATSTAVVDVGDAITAVDELKDELQDKFDEMSEKAQEGEKGTKLGEDINSLEELSSDLDNLKSELEEDSPFDGVINTFNELTGEKK